MNWRAVTALVAAFLLARVAHSATDVSCRDPKGSAIDWWIALKAPEGSKYGYIDASMSTPAFTAVLDDELAELSGNPLANTVQQVYPDSSDEHVSYVTWNDQPYGEKGEARSGPYHAHAKGVIGYAGNQGFYLVHSNPRFPADPSKDSYSGIGNCTESGSKCGPDFGQQKYAQSYLCITMDGKTLERVADAVVIAHLTITDHDTEAARNEFPNLNRLATTKFPLEEVPDKQNISQTITSLGGEQFVQFVMSPTAAGDDVYLYEQLVEPVLQSGLLVETWIESPVFPSYCLEMPSSLPHPPKYNHPDPPFEYNTYVVHNVKISDDLEWANPHTKNEGDHSKWAVTFLPPPPPHDASDAAGATTRKLLGGAAAAKRRGGGGDGYPKSVCIGDINRAGHQLQRGGGTVCFVANDALWESFYGIVEKWDKCHAQRSA